MYDPNRDLLVLSNTSHLSAEAFHRQLDLLNALLHHAESWENFCRANELIDINLRKIIRDPARMQRILRMHKPKAFVFTNNKN